jgi:hypothetical protein
MGAATYDLEMDQGSSFSMEFQFMFDGAPRVLTNYLVRAQMRTHKKASDVSATFICNVTDALDGRVSITLSKADRETIIAGEYLYDLELYTADEEEVTRMLEGKVFVTEGVIR